MGRVRAELSEGAEDRFAHLERVAAHGNKRGGRRNKGVVGGAAGEARVARARLGRADAADGAVMPPYGRPSLAGWRGGRAARGGRRGRRRLAPCGPAGLPAGPAAPGSGAGAGSACPAGSARLAAQPPGTGPSLPAMRQRGREPHGMRRVRLRGLRLLRGLPRYGAQPRLCPAAAWHSRAGRAGHGRGFPHRGPGPVGAERSAERRRWRCAAVLGGAACRGLRGGRPVSHLGGDRSRKDRNGLSGLMNNALTIRNIRVVLYL
ncbi:hypothetical protein [Paenibacillus campinasensis]|uniref:hypothetical protein n=1 Tax=Paenibacillus campinasensis TaxID=66347 RepID=UPI0015C6B238|nr:hypothetical protein [Paenibacillus campinasensis]